MPHLNRKNRTKNQHYVPRLHLRRFVGAQPKNMVWVYSKGQLKARPSRVEETGSRNNFYSILSENGVYHDDIDEMLEKIENLAAEPYRGLLSGSIPQGQRRADFAMFLATAFSRSPAQIRAYAEAMARAWQTELRVRTQTKAGFDDLIKGMDEAGIPIEDPENLHSFIHDPSRYWLSVSEKRGLEAIGVADDLAPILFARRWRVAVSPVPLVTSDNPLALLPTGMVGQIAARSFRSPIATVTYPLSTSKLLVIEGKLGAVGSANMSVTEAEMQNAYRVANAEDLIFADRHDPALVEQVAAFAEFRPRIKIGHDFATDVEVKITR